MRIRLSVWMLWTGMLLTGCIRHTVHIPKDQQLLKAETVTKSALLDMLKLRSTAIKTLTVTQTSLKARHMKSQDAWEEYTGAGGSIVVDRPNHIRMDIEKVVTLADLVSDGKQYSISIPHFSEFGVADLDAPVGSAEFPYNLRPSHILDALFVDGDQYLSDAGVIPIRREASDPIPGGVHSYYILLFVKTQNGEALEELWVDRNILEVTRKIKYREDGRVEADIQYSGYEMVDSIPFPKKIFIRRPIEDYTLDMNLVKLELNKTIDADVFKLERPEGANDLDLTTGKVIKRP